MTTTTLDFRATETRARRMTNDALRYSAQDASEAAVMADSLELDGFRVLKSGGYYRDEAGVYRAELKRRGAA